MKAKADILFENNPIIDLKKQMFKEKLVCESKNPEESY